MKLVNISLGQDDLPNRERQPGPARPAQQLRSSAAPIEERQPLEQMHVLLVLQQRAMQRRNHHLRPPWYATPPPACPRPSAASASPAARDVAASFFRPGTSRTWRENTVSASRARSCLMSGIMCRDDPLHRLAVRETGYSGRNTAAGNASGNSFSLFDVIMHHRPMLGAFTVRSRLVDEGTACDRVQAADRSGNSISALSISSISTTTGRVGFERIP